MTKALKLVGFGIEIQSQSYRLISYNYITHSINLTEKIMKKNIKLKHQCLSVLLSCFNAIFSKVIINWFRFVYVYCLTHYILI